MSSAAEAHVVARLVAPPRVHVDQLRLARVATHGGRRASADGEHTRIPLPGSRVAALAECSQCVLQLAHRRLAKEGLPLRMRDAALRPLRLGDLQRDLMPHAERARRMVLVATPPTEDRRHGGAAERDRRVDVRQRRLALERLQRKRGEQRRAQHFRRCYAQKGGGVIFFSFSARLRC